MPEYEKVTNKALPKFQSSMKDHNRFLQIMINYILFKMLYSRNPQPWCVTAPLNQNKGVKNMEI